MTGDTSRMRATANEVTNNGNKYKERIEEIFSKVEALSSNWQGADYDQFKATCQKHREPLNELGEAINGFGKALNEAADGLDKTVSKLKGIM